jgi:hypothetical protein
MTDQDEIVRAYNVQYSDSWLGVEDFRTIRAEDEEEAREIFQEEYAKEDRQEITEVEEAYELNKTKIEDLLGGLES